ncbi:MAG TPA: helix-turn-helix transcriptional regulator [Candidatus Gallacutalibacter stercoravium]|nr:helix-turn-helix transcriptional regulator [Candidatus Gallacutalibacter stercoravium]
MSSNLKQDISIGENLQKLRRQARFTQAQASARLAMLGINVSPAVLAKMEQGRYSVRISVLLALKQIYKVRSFDEFFKDLSL